jgi:hypothetical protein
MAWGNNEEERKKKMVSFLLAAARARNESHSAGSPVAADGLNKAHALDDTHARGDAAKDGVLAYRGGVERERKVGRASGKTRPRPAHRQATAWAPA